MSARRAAARRGDQTSRSTPEAGPRRARFPFVTLLLAVALAVLAPAAATHAQVTVSEAPIPAAAGFVNDHAGKLDDDTRARLEAFLDQVKKKTGVEFAVLVVPTTAPESPSEYKVRVFKAWGIGNQERDDGLLMLVAIEEREVRFETGYGLEGTLPDGLQSRIFRREMAPRFRDGDYAGGITAGVLECAGKIAAEKGVTLEWDGRELRYGGGDRVPASKLIIIAILIAFIILSIVSRSGGGGGFGGRRRWRGGWYIGPGAFGGGFGGFGGGFGGGGGGGGSFGGFGGGSSGGGGGGGKW